MNLACFFYKTIWFFFLLCYVQNKKTSTTSNKKQRNVGGENIISYIQHMLFFINKQIIGGENHGDS